MNNQKETLLKQLDDKLRELEIAGELEPQLIEDIKAIKTAIDSIDLVTPKDTKEEEGKALDNFFRGNEVNRETRGITTTLGGGALINTEVYGEIIENLYDEVDFLRLANVHTSKGNVKVLRETDLGEATFVEELQKIREKDVIFDYVELKPNKVATLVNITAELLHNTEINMSTYLTNMITRRIARALNKAFLTGTGVNEPNGLLNCKTRYEFTDGILIEDFIKMQSRLNQRYLTNKTYWIMSRQTYNIVCSMLDSVGNPYVKYTSDSEGNLKTYLLGLEILVSEYMPEMMKGKSFVVLANLEKAYVINMANDININHLSELGFTSGIETFASYVVVDGNVLEPGACCVGYIK